MTDRIDVDAELGRLKDFQLETVRYAYGRLFRDDDARRFLVADEVGLGKTLVARGVTALVVDELQRSGKVGRIDIVYVCSNADIARQNIRRLNVTGRDDVALASRITLLPLETHKLRSNEINLISLTPGTSLDPHSSLGVSKERAVLFWMLKEAIGYRRNSKSVLRALRGDAAMASFPTLSHRSTRATTQHHRSIQGLTARFRRRGRTKRRAGGGVPGRCVTG